MRIFIEPTEPLLFRTGRPFNAGESNFAETIFPPTPETLQGALRAMIAAQWSKSSQGRSRRTNDLFSEPGVVELIGRRLGDRNVYGRFRLTGLTLGRRDERTHKVSRLFPAPAHLIQATLKDGSGKTAEIVRLAPRSLSQDASNHPPGTQLLFPERGEKKSAGKSEPLTGWLTSLGLRRALSKEGFPGTLEKEEKEKYLIPAHKIYERESRLGIGMNNATKTTEEGYLYQVQMVRMQPHYGFVVDIKFGEERYGDSELPHLEQLRTPPELAFLREGWLTLGGEQRVARFNVLQAEEIAEEGINQTASGNLLYFATPAYFKNGWLPQDPNILPAKPLTAALERYQPIGGWLLTPGTAGGASKLTRRCIPAGSVYYFDKSVSVTHPITEYGWQIGYGIAYTGEY
jgi:CRISPR-associated protein Cmr3